jgi:hypothetical protein
MAFGDAGAEVKTPGAGVAKSTMECSQYLDILPTSIFSVDNLSILIFKSSTTPSMPGL